MSHAIYVGSSVTIPFEIRDHETHEYVTPAAVEVTYDGPGVDPITRVLGVDPELTELDVGRFELRLDIPYDNEVAGKWTAIVRATGEKDVAFPISWTVSQVPQQTAGETPITTKTLVANIAALMLVEDSRIGDGTLAHVATVRDLFLLHKTSTATVDGIVVVATKSGTGRWHRLSIPNLAWARQAAWFIDPTSGNDENAGSSSGAAIKTHAELVRRIGSLTINQVTDVTVLGNLPASDPMRVLWHIGKDGAVRYKGQRTTVASGAFTAVTSAARGTNTPGSVTDTGLTWASHIGRRIRTTSGASAGAVAWALKDLGANAVRVSQWIIPSNSLPVANSFALRTVSVADAYVVETLTTVAEAHVAVVVSPVAAQTGLVFEDLDFGSTALSVQTNNSLFNVAFLGCAANLRVMAGGVIAHACKHVGATASGGSLRIIAGGCMTSSITGGAMAQLSVDGDTILQGVALTVSGNSVIVLVGCFDASGDAVTINPGATIQSSNLLYGAHAIWGSDAAGYGVRVRPGARTVYTSTKPTVTGSSGDAIIGGTARTWAQVPYFEAANGAAIVVQA